MNLDTNIGGNVSASFDVNSMTKPSDLQGFWVDRKPFALLTISTNFAGKYKRMESSKQIVVSLLKDINDLIFRWEHVFWNTHYVTREVSNIDRFQGVVFLEKLETHPHAHILLFFHPDKERGFISAFDREMEIDRILHFFVYQYCIARAGKKLNLIERDFHFISYPEVREWDINPMKPNQAKESFRLDAMAEIFPGGEFHIESILDAETHRKQVVDYCSKELGKNNMNDWDGYSFLNQTISSNHYSGVTLLPRLGGRELVS